MRRWMLTVAPLLAALALSACNSTESVLNPSSAETSTAVGAGSADGQPATSLPTPADSEEAASATPLAPAGTLDAQAAALSTNARVQFAPIVGATVESVTPLTRRLSQRAAQRGLSLVASGTADTTHLMKGYFSAISDDGETTVIYVWDVLDPAGNRLHRIQGQEKVTGATAEGWPGVPGPTMETIADSTIDQLAAWLAAHPG